MLKKGVVTLCSFIWTNSSSFPLIARVSKVGLKKFSHFQHLTKRFSYRAFAGAQISQNQLFSYSASRGGAIFASSSLQLFVCKHQFISVQTEIWPQHLRKPINFFSSRTREFQQRRQPRFWRCVIHQIARHVLENRKTEIAITNGAAKMRRNRNCEAQN